MQIKRFEAKDMTTALRLIKRELGPDAVILSARSLKKENKIVGLVKSVGVEVTAAVDGYHLAAASRPALAAGVVNRYRLNEKSNLPSKRNFRQSVGSRIRSFYDRKPAAQSEEKMRLNSDDLLADVFQHLLSQEVKRDSANAIIDGLTAKHLVRRFETTDQIVSSISNILERKRNGSGNRLCAKSGCQVLAVVGPTGVGKTTTVAKLAARYAIEEDKKVALISLDCDRVGGNADLKIYAKAMGLPLLTAATSSAFKDAVNEFREFDIILVDTSGFNPQKQDQIDNLRVGLDGIGAVSIHLVLSAISKESDLLQTLRCLNSLDVQQLIFTKLDESCTCGNLINVLMHYPLPLSYITAGREVPDAIEAGSMDKIVKRLLYGFKHRKALRDAPRPNHDSLEGNVHSDSGGFVANKNSDVFHRYDCKWTQKIKSENMVTFSSAQAAKRENFMPCQDCRPASSRGFKAGLPLRDNVRISNCMS